VALKDPAQVAGLRVPERDRWRSSLAERCLNVRHRGKHATLPSLVDGRQHLGNLLCRPRVKRRECTPSAGREMNELPPTVLGRRAAAHYASAFEPR
jgi:hypothetical protein